MITFKQFISESTSDKGIFKAMFVIGLPGAGKSYTVTQLKGVISPKVVNTDKAAEFMSTKMGKEINGENWLDYKDGANRITRNMLQGYLDGMLPLFVDGTSNDVSNILHRIGILESLGYDVGIIFVNASLETAKRRAKERAEKIGRHVDEDFIERVHKRNEENAGYLKSKVDFYREIENDTDGLNDTEMNKAFKEVQSFFNEPLKNPVGKRALAKLEGEKQKYLVPSVVTKDVLSKKVDGWYKS